MGKAYLVLIRLVYRTLSLVTRRLKQARVKQARERSLAGKGAAMLRFTTALLFAFGFSLAQTTGFTLEAGSQVTVQDAGGATIGSGLVEDGTLILNLAAGASGPVVLVVTDAAGNVTSYQAVIDEDDDDADLIDADDIDLVAGGESRDFDDVLAGLGIGFALAQAPFVDADGDGVMDDDGTDDDGMDDDGTDDDGDDTGNDDGNDGGDDSDDSAGDDDGNDGDDDNDDGGNDDGDDGGGSNDDNNGGGDDDDDDGSGDDDGNDDGGNDG